MFASAYATNDFLRLTFVNFGDFFRCVRSNATRNNDQMVKMFFDIFGLVPLRFIDDGGGGIWLKVLVVSFLKLLLLFLGLFFFCFGDIYRFYFYLNGAIIIRLFLKIVFFFDLI